MVASGCVEPLMALSRGDCATQDDRRSVGNAALALCRLALPDGRYVREESRRNVIFGLSKAKELLGRAIPFFLIEPMALAVDALTSHQSSLAARAAINPEVAIFDVA